MVYSSVKSITARALSSVDGDPQAGICSVGTRSCTHCGTSCWALWCSSCGWVGFVLPFVLCSVIKQGCSKTGKLEQLMTLHGLLDAALYMPASTVVACSLEEWNYHIVGRLSSSECGAGSWPTVPQAQVLGAQVFHVPGGEHDVGHLDLVL